MSCMRLETNACQIQASSMQASYVPGFAFNWASINLDARLSNEPQRSHMHTDIDISLAALCRTPQTQRQYAEPD
jgi:hypothetical protein